MLRKLPVIVAGVLVLFANCASAAGCRLDPADFESLRLSKSHIETQSQVDNLSEPKLRLLCNTRSVWKRIRTNADNVPDSDFDLMSPYYLSPSEGKIYGALSDARVQAILNKMTPEQWQKLRQEILNATKPR